MIKISFVQESYSYPCTEGQPYKIETNMELDEDIDTVNAILAFVRLLNIATYHVTSKTLMTATQFLEEEEEVRKKIDFN